MLRWLILLCLFIVSANARDLDGKYANSPLHSWFNSLGSGKGLCCSFADGVSVRDVDWDTQKFCEHDTPPNGERVSCTQHYRVFIDGKWIVVPDSALVTVPNKFGAAVVWPYKDSDGTTQIRCFLPGAGA